MVNINRGEIMIKKIMFYIGIIIFVLGLCSADSENLLIPTALLFGGLFIAHINS